MRNLHGNSLFQALIDKKKNKSMGLIDIPVENLETGK